MSQESLLRLLSGVTSALEDLVLMCSNLEASDSSVLEKWLDELLEEADSQKDMINDIIEQLSERSEDLLLHREEKKESSGPSIPGGEQVVSKPAYTFKSMTHMTPPVLHREVRPSELRAWESKFDTWMSCSLQGTPLSDFKVNTLLSLMDPWWHNRLLPKRGIIAR